MRCVSRIREAWVADQLPRLDVDVKRLGKLRTLKKKEEGEAEKPVDLETKAASAKERYLQRKKKA